MIDPNDPAFPVPPPSLTVNNDFGSDPANGITVRAYFAALAMQGLMASGKPAGYEIAQMAIYAADTLISQINHNPQSKA